MLLDKSDEIGRILSYRAFTCRKFKWVAIVAIMLTVQLSVVLPVFAWHLRIAPASTSSIILDIMFQLNEIGFREGNSTALFVLTNASGAFPEFEISDIRSFPLENPTTTLVYYVLQSEGNTTSISGIEVRTALPRSENYSGVARVIVQLTRLPSSDEFMRLEYADYPFDEYSFELGLLIFYPQSGSGTYTFSWGVSYSGARTIELHPDKTASLRLDKFGEALSDSGGAGRTAVFFATDGKITLARNTVERTLLPLSIMVALLLMLLIPLFAIRYGIGEATKLYVALVVVNLGILQQSFSIGDIAFRGANLSIIILGFATASLVVTTLNIHLSLVPSLMGLFALTTEIPARYFELSLREPLVSALAYPFAFTVVFVAAFYLMIRILPRRFKWIVRRTKILAKLGKNTKK